MESLATFLTEHMNGVLGKDAIPFIISLFPILELRGGMIAARLIDVEYVRALILCIIGNIIPIPFILFFINKIFAFVKRKSRTLGGILEKIEGKALKKRDRIEKGEIIGLILFVGIPIPGTGAWTGSLIASLLGIDIKKSSISILIGIALAATIMSIVTYLVPYLIGSAVQ